MLQIQKEINGISRGCEQGSTNRFKEVKIFKVLQLSQTCHHYSTFLLNKAKMLVLLWEEYFGFKVAQWEKAETCHPSLHVVNVSYSCQP